ncbi:hypothetical protein [Caulobacter sp. UNC358MFTsu5.1]|uniref:YaaC family protein n=1 Tax=Caulobacter sp. UNC358MFTsu5.1 TaxID=1449049 RepID=UPI0012DDE72B|nr:hypothetical protein [Caulobacter sp. UNC358MFTsu5.1]
MIISNLTIANESDALHHVWLRLKRYQNIQYTYEILRKHHDIPERYKKFAKKQSEQIRHCLIQAEEYATAANAVSYATNPLLYYYSIMSLALAEVLYKQDGDSSLDRVRNSHGHHGLELKGVDTLPVGAPLEVSAAALRAVPHQNGTGRAGTFELWHRSARELPIVGKHTTYFLEGTRNETYATLGIGADKRFPLLRCEGMTLLDCYSNMPRMAKFLEDHQLRSKICRSTMSVDTRHAERTNITCLSIHPQNRETIENTVKSFGFGPNSFESLQIDTMYSGYIIRLRDRTDMPPSIFQLPNAIQENCSNIWFCEDNQSLNEFGLYYLALYIVGMYARYYPDKWMLEIEKSTPLALSVMELIAAANDRVPVIILGEFSRSMIVRR